MAGNPALSRSGAGAYPTTFKGDQWGGEIVGSARIDRALHRLQREVGDAYWTAMDMQSPQWLEERYEILNRDLNLDGFQGHF